MRMRSYLELGYFDVRLFGQHEADASRNRTHALVIAQACTEGTVGHAV